MSLYLLLMSYLFTLLISVFLLCVTVLPGHSYADGQPVINEILVHPGSGKNEWVELYVPDGSSLNNYWIDDDTDFTSDTGSSTKKQITAVIQGSDSQHVVYELSSSMFNNDGDTVALFAPDGTLIDHYTYTKDPGTDISMGRTPDGTGDFQILASATEGSPNSSPQPTSTPTPMPTEKPTKEPKPTDTPKPVKSVTAIPIPTTTKSSPTNKSVLSASTTHAVLSHISLSPQSATNSSHPTSILKSVATQAKKKITDTPTKRVLVKGASSSIGQFVAVILGGIVFLTCGILLYLKKVGKIHF
jgi:lamin tail-like protein